MASDEDGAHHRGAYTMSDGEGAQPDTTYGGRCIAEGHQEAVLSQERVHERTTLQEWDTLDTVEKYWNARKRFFTHEQRAEAWKKTAENLQKYSDEMVDRWNKEIDTLLVFAGLFSAILTAFNVQSYQLLTPPPATDPVIVALEKISAQLSSFSVTTPSVNSTQPAFIYHESPPSPAPQWAVWLNALWFSSLIFSLSSASIGIMVKQWLNEYNSGLSGTPRHMARLRRLRLNSLRRWRVKEIVAMLPVLLQIASALFFAGLLVLLWQLNRTVALVGSVLVGVLIIFSVSTIILPSVTAHCSYLSPPSRALLKLVKLLRRLFYLCYVFWGVLFSWPSINCQCGLGSEWAESISEDEEAQRTSRYAYDQWQVLTGSKEIHDWQKKEHSLVIQLGDKLDAEVITTAYTLTMDPNYLDHAAVCTTELSLDATRRCFIAIQAENRARWGKVDPDHILTMHSEVHPSMWSGALLALTTANGADTPWSQHPLVHAPQVAYYYLASGPRNRHVRSDLSLPWTRLASMDLAWILRHHPATVQHIARKIRRYGLGALMREASELDLGLDVRNYVASSIGCEQMLQKGLAATNSNLTSTRHALHSVQCIVSCVPWPNSPDYQPSNPEYHALRAEAVRALEDLSVFLTTSRATKFSESVGHVFGVLRKHGEQAGLLSAKLIRAMSDYLAVCNQVYDGQLPSSLAEQQEWVQTLQRNPNGSRQDPIVVHSQVASTRIDGCEVVNLPSVVSPNAAAEPEADQARYSTISSASSSLSDQSVRSAGAVPAGSAPPNEQTDTAEGAMFDSVDVDDNVPTPPPRASDNHHTSQETEPCFSRASPTLVFATLSSSNHDDT